MEVLVFGAGSLGSLVGGLLARSHEVTLVGRDPHVTAIRERGLHVTGEFEFTVHPDARTEPPESADLAVVTVKAFDTETAARALGSCSLDAALSLQNGMGNEETLATRLACPILAGTCTYGARLSDPGVVECTGLGEVVLGPPGGGESEHAERVGGAFSADLETHVSPEMPRRLWEKLAVNAGINPVTALARVRNGALVDGPTSDLAREAAAETARVAREQGVDLDDETAVEAVASVATATADNTSSMLQDVQSTSRTEIDAISGYVVERAETTVPVNRTLAALLRGWERGVAVR
ncbi:ketopantoate reductase family protein [Haloarculaceae archaeon H-GB2-1]|nr:ketopantoate reductase family protein [Haloarculaceae archaeon H-GB1-1]MEA5406250.1 ketopantoate reductase family protein [Haloarculaceae archaeon H-GB2-1]